jgi:hypothetical protein
MAAISRLSIRGNLGIGSLLSLQKCRHSRIISKPSAHFDSFDLTSVACNAMQRNAMQRNAMQCNAMQRNAIQRNAT